MHVDERMPVQLSLVLQQRIGIRLFTAIKKNIFKRIIAPGRMAFDPHLYVAKNEYLIAAKHWNQVKKRGSAQAQRNAEHMMRAARTKLTVLGLSQEYIDQFIHNAQNSDARVRALIAKKGNTRWVYADVFEKDIPYITSGLSVEVTGSFLRGERIQGTVISVDRVVNPQTRTAQVRVQLDPSHHMVLHQAYVRVEIKIPLGEHTVVPLEAILHTGKQTFVFVKQKSGGFEPRVVHIDLETDDEASIANGLRRGEQVVVGGNFMLDSESRLKAVIQESVTTHSRKSHH